MRQGLEYVVNLTLMRILLLVHGPPRPQQRALRRSHPTPRGHYRLTRAVIRVRATRRRLDQIDVFRRLQLKVEIIFWILPTLSVLGRYLEIQSGSKNIPLHFSAPYVQNDSRGHIICDLTFEHIRTSGHSYARSAARLLLGNMTGSVTKDSTQAKRSSFAEVICQGAETGVVAVGLPVQMH